MEPSCLALARSGEPSGRRSRTLPHRPLGRAGGRSPALRRRGLPRGQRRLGRAVLLGLLALLRVLPELGDQPAGRCGRPGGKGVRRRGSGPGFPGTPVARGREHQPGLAQPRGGPGPGGIGPGRGPGPAPAPGLEFRGLRRASHPGPARRGGGHLPARRQGLGPGPGGPAPGCPGLSGRGPRGPGRNVAAGGPPGPGRTRGGPARAPGPAPGPAGRVGRERGLGWTGSATMRRARP